LVKNIQPGHRRAGRKNGVFSSFYIPKGQSRKYYEIALSGKAVHSTPLPDRLQNAACFPSPGGGAAGYALLLEKDRRTMVE
jgi:hypothetical protein